MGNWKLVLAEDCGPHAYVSRSRTRIRAPKFSSLRVVLFVCLCFLDWITLNVLAQVLPLAESSLTRYRLAVEHEETYPYVEEISEMREE